MHRHPGLFQSREAKNREKHRASRAPAIRPTVAYVSVEKRGLIPTIRNYQEENMKYLALSPPSFPSLFSSSNFLRGKKSQEKVKDGRETTVCFPPMIICTLFSGGGWVRKHQHGLVGVRTAEGSPSGDGMTHAEVEHGIWFMLLGSGEESGLGRGLVQVGSKRACSRAMAVRHREAFSMHKRTNNHRRVQTVHAYIHDRVETHTTLSFFAFFSF